MAFKTSKNYTPERINEISETKGMSMGCSITRDAATYRIDTLRGAVSDALHLLADTVLYPELKEDDISEAKVRSKKPLRETAGAAARSQYIWKICSIKCSK